MPPIAVLVLLNAFKPGIEDTPAEEVYGTALRLPAQVFKYSSDEPVPGFRNYATQLIKTMRNLRPTPPR